MDKQDETAPPNEKEDITMSPPQKEDEAQTQLEEEDVNSALEEVLRHAGEMGLYQKLLFLGMLPLGITWSFVYFGQMFITATPQEHWCKVPELESLTPELRYLCSEKKVIYDFFISPFVKEVDALRGLLEELHLSTPKTSDSDYDRCRMFNANWTVVLKELLPPDPSTPTILCQNGWDFLFDDIPYETVVSERGWVCDNAHLVPWSQTISFVGSMCGNILFGSLADRYGRVPILMAANLVGGVGSIASIFTKTFWDFVAARFLIGMANNQCFMLMYILEYVGVKYRTAVANMSIALYFGGGCILLPWLAYWVADWRLLMMISSVPMFLVLIAPFTIPESARWLTSKGRHDDAVKILRRFERVNGNKIPEEAINKFISASKNQTIDDKGISSLFKIPTLRNIVLVLVVCVLCTALAFDSLIRMSENIGFNFFVTFTITSATEIPSIMLLVVLLDRYGRRMLFMVPMLLIFGPSLIAAFLGDGVATLVLVTSARFCSNMSYNVMIQWTPELMPTAVRAAGSALIHTLASAAIIVSPFVVYTYRIWHGLPLCIVAAAALAGALMAWLLPETTGEKMPQTVEDVQALRDKDNTRRKKNKKVDTAELTQI